MYENSRDDLLKTFEDWRLMPIIPLIVRGDIVNILSQGNFNEKLNQVKLDFDNYLWNVGRVILRKDVFTEEEGGRFMSNGYLKLKPTWILDGDELSFIPRSWLFTSFRAFALNWWNKEERLWWKNCFPIAGVQACFRPEDIPYNFDGSDDKYLEENKGWFSKIYSDVATRRSKRPLFVQSSMEFFFSEQEQDNISMEAYILYSSLWYVMNKWIDKENIRIRINNKYKTVLPVLQKLIEDNDICMKILDKLDDLSWVRWLWNRWNYWSIFKERKWELIEFLKEQGIVENDEWKKWNLYSFLMSIIDTGKWDENNLLFDDMYYEAIEELKNVAKKVNKVIWNDCIEVDLSSCRPSASYTNNTYQWDIYNNETKQRSMECFGGWDYTGTFNETFNVCFWKVSWIAFGEDRIWFLDTWKPTNQSIISFEEFKKILLSKK